MQDHLRIKFFCRSFDRELYLLSRGLYEQAGYPCVRLTDQTADGYFYAMLADEECDVAINVDEDCFIADLDAVAALARRVADEGWVNAGCSDAGLGVPRSGEADVTNPFFNVFNLRMIRRSWDARRLVGELSHGSHLTLEPYYNFFHWMLRTFPGRTLYLSNERHADGISTLLYAPSPDIVDPTNPSSEAADPSHPSPDIVDPTNPSSEAADPSHPSPNIVDSTQPSSDVVDPTHPGAGSLLCVHTWFARLYHTSWLTRIFEGNDLKDVDHSQRIRARIDEVYGLRGLPRPTFSLSDRLVFRADAVARWSVKVPQRMARWPRKLMRKFG